jgi:glycosyltransferase involved in cell wall biosynthesis
MHHKGLFVMTQVVDERDTNLAFFVRWLAELAKHASVIHVACWKEGEHPSLPANVHVYAMPKGKIKRMWALMRLSWTVRKDVSAVFVHMLAPVAAALGWYWKLLGKRLVLWYTHGSVPMSLRLANVFVDKICTATSESMRLLSAKKIVTGHGIDTNTFSITNVSRKPILLTVGRVSPRKKLEELIQLASRIHEQNPELNFHLDIVGEPYLESDHTYQETLRTLIASKNLSDIVRFHGALLGNDLISTYQEAALFVTASQTGSLDKAVLESLACGTPVVAASNVFGGFEGVRLTNGAWSDEDIRFASETLKNPTSSQVAHQDVATKAGLSSLVSRLAQILLA